MWTKTYFEVWPVLDCNLKCARCSMASPYFKKNTFLNFKEYKKDIDVLKQWCHIDLIRIGGGEPTLHPKIVDFLKYPKEQGFCYKTNIISNGINLVKMTDEFWEALDILNISVYKNVNINYDKIYKLIEKKLAQYPHLQCNEITNPEVVGNLQAVQKDIHSKNATVNILSGNFKELYRNTPQRNDMLTEIAFRKCWMKDSTWGFHQGNFYRCPLSFVKEKLYIQEGLDNPYDYGLDRVNLHEKDSKEKLEKFLFGPINHLQACKTCYAFNDGDDHPHEQLNRIDVRDILHV